MASPVINNLICPDHGVSGQIMERHPDGGYICPECGRKGDYLTWFEDSLIASISENGGTYEND